VGIVTGGAVGPGDTALTKVIFDEVFIRCIVTGETHLSRLVFQKARISATVWVMTRCATSLGNRFVVILLREPLLHLCMTGKTEAGATFDQ